MRENYSKEKKNISEFGPDNYRDGISDLEIGERLFLTTKGTKYFTKDTKQRINIKYFVPFAITFATFVVKERTHKRHREYTEGHRIINL